MPRNITVSVTRKGYTIKGTYHGGPYIDLSFEDGRAFEVINVYDYAAGKPSIPFTVKAVRDEVIDWFENVDDSLDHDMREYRLSVGR